MQYVACKFRSEDTRSYTYHYEGEDPLAVGDIVKVADRSGDGWKRVHVAAITDEAPSFPTKPILGLLTGEDTDRQILDAGAKAAPLTISDDDIAF